MIVEFELFQVHCEKANDNPVDPFNKRVELYQTWQLSSTNPLKPGSDELWTRLGFSLKGGPDAGVSFGTGDQRILNDPHFFFKTPDLSAGASTAFNLDVHWWESDNEVSTKKVRAVYTDKSFSLLQAAWSAAAEDAALARRRLQEWIEGNGTDIARIAVAAASAGTTGPAWLPVAEEALPILIEAVKHTADAVKGIDDYLGAHRMSLCFQNQGGLQWRVLNTGTPSAPWISGEGQQKISLPFSEPDGRTHGAAVYLCRVHNLSIADGELGPA